MAAWNIPLPAFHAPLAKSANPSFVDSSTLVSIINKRSLSAAYFSASDKRDSSFGLAFALIASAANGFAPPPAGAAAVAPLPGALPALACNFAVISFNLASFSALYFALVASAPVAPPAAGVVPP